MKKIIVPVILLFLIVMTGMLSGCTTTNSNNTNGGTNGENFTFQLPDGTQKELKEYRGKIVILDMWATWCSPCQYQMLELKKAYDYYSREDLEILSINIDARETNQDIIDFIALFSEYGYNLNWIFGNEIDDTTKYKKEPNSGIPSICFFDRDGNIIYKHVGVMLYDTITDNWTGEKVLLREKIDELINN